MLLKLIKKEILEHLMSLRFAIACVLCLVVILSSLFVRSRDYAQVFDDFKEESAMSRNEMDQWDHPWRVVWDGVDLHLKPNTMKIFVRGVEDANGGVVAVNSHLPANFVTTDLQNTSVPLFPPMDTVAFVGIIMSLMAMVFGYDAICGEKERGTLRLMLSYSVPRDRVLLSKWIGGYVTLVVPFLLAALGGAGLILVQSAIELTADQWYKFAAVVGLALLYIASIYSFSVWVSCLTRRSSTSIMLLVAAWVVLVLAVPNLAPYLARVWKPTRNVQQIENDRHAKYQSTWNEHVRDKMKEYDKQHGFGRRWWREVNWRKWTEPDKPVDRRRAAIRRVHELQLERDGHLRRLDAYRKIDEQFENELDAQIRLSRQLLRASPFSCFAMSAAELADAGLVSKQRLLAQVRRHQRALCEYGHQEWIALEQYQLDNEGKRAPSWKKKRLKPVPVFVYAPPAAGDYVKAVAVDAGLLAGLAILFFLLSFVSFVRYDVR